MGDEENVKNLTFSITLSCFIHVDLYNQKKIFIYFIFQINSNEKL